jgi:signal transduction histidine kinase
VENHRGTIEVGRTPDGGARFTVLLPAHPDPPAVDTPAESS